MSYEYAMSGPGALGFSDPRSTCSEIEGGETRCFRSREASAASGYHCRTLSQACEVGSDSGTMYCCPQFGATRAPAGSTTPAAQEGGVLTQVANTMKGILGVGAPTTTTPSQSVTKTIETVARTVASDAQVIAFQETSDAASDAAGGAGAGTNQGGGIQPWYQQYQVPIMIGTAAIGLLMTFIWLIARKR
jgi:hypothetical protein